jgi:hypothetical protein
MPCAVGDRDDRVALLQSEDNGESWSELGERIGGITALAVK